MTFRDMAYKIGDTILSPKDISHILMEVDASSGNVEFEVIERPLRIENNEIAKKKYCAKIDDVELIVDGE